jgi:hypothetical protein
MLYLRAYTIDLVHSSARMKGDVNANKLPQNYHCPTEGYITVLVNWVVCTLSY